MFMRTDDSYKHPDTTCILCGKEINYNNSHKLQTLEYIYGICSKCNKKDFTVLDKLKKEYIELNKEIDHKRHEILSEIERLQIDEKDVI